MIIDENKLKARFGYGDWSLTKVEELLNLNEPMISNILKKVSSDLFIVALHKEPEEIKDLFLKSCSNRLKKQLIKDMKNAHHSLSQIQSAQTELLSTAKEQLSIIEQILWSEIISILPTVYLPEHDISFIYSLNSELTKQWMEKTPIKQQIQILTDDNASKQFWEKTMKPIIGEKAVKVIEADCLLYEPQFAWEVQIARSLVMLNTRK